MDNEDVYNLIASYLLNNNGICSSKDILLELFVLIAYSDSDKFKKMVKTRILIQRLNK